MEKLIPVDQVEEVDTRGEDDDYFYSNSSEERIKHEIIKLGQPWNKSIDINDPQATEKIRKQGEDARRIQQLREALAKMIK